MSEYRNKNGGLVCEVDGCDRLATHTLRWTMGQDFEWFCTRHAAQLLEVATAVKHRTPYDTCRLLSFDEMIGPETR